MIDDWEEKLVTLTDWPEDNRYILFIDESGSSDLKHIRKSISKKLFINDGERYFTVTGMLLDRNVFPSLKKEVLTLKEKYWPDGKYLYPSGLKRVCFHSSEIRKKEGPFFFGGSIDTYNLFVKDLSELMTRLDYTIMATTIDKFKLVTQYADPYYPYTLALIFLIERFVRKKLDPLKENGLLVLEARGGKEDNYLRKEILRILKKDGTRYYSPDSLNRIKGVYFNPKWCEASNGMKSYVANEIADLLAHPIMQFSRSGNKNLAFQAIENKFLGFPSYMTVGLKKFP